MASAIRVGKRHTARLGFLGALFFTCVVPKNVYNGRQT